MYVCMNVYVCTHNLMRLSIRSAGPPGSYRAGPFPKP